MLTNPTQFTGTMSSNIKEIFDNDKDLKEINKIVEEISLNIRCNNRNWIRGEGVCEVCGLRPAEVNLDLKYGSHRECRSCWDD